MFNPDPTSVYAVIASKLYPFTIYARKVKNIQVFSLEMDKRPTSPSSYEEKLLLALSIASLRHSQKNDWTLKHLLFNIMQDCRVKRGNGYSSVQIP
jgi:hypothetical protein